MCAQYIGGCSVHRGDTMSTSGDIMINVGGPGGHSITKHTGGGWLEGLNQKPQYICPRITIFKKC